MGGKGASRPTGGYVLDFGPHAYHPKTRVINRLIEGHAGAEYVLGPVRMALILKGRTLRYPFQPLEGLRKLPLTLSARMVSDYAVARLRHWARPVPETSFKSWGESRFGRTLYRLCFGDYTERVWGVSADQLSVELAKRKLPRFSIRGVLSEAWLKRGAMHAHLFGSQFGYHRLGIGRIYEAIVAGIERRGGQVLRAHEVTGLRGGADGRVTAVLATGPEGPVEVPCDAVVSTIPLTRLQTLVDEAGLAPPPTERAVDFRDILLAYACVGRPRFSDAHWIYLVDNRFAFQRISEQKNLSEVCCPAGKTVLTLEISAAAGSGASSNVRQLVESDLAFFGVRGEEIEKVETFTLSDAYPVYRVGYEVALAAAFDRLGTIGNLVSTGRQGLFLDIDMHDAMVLGRAGVDALGRGEPSSSTGNTSASSRGQGGRLNRPASRRFAGFLSRDPGAGRPPPLARSSLRSSGRGPRGRSAPSRPTIGREAGRLGRQDPPSSACRRSAARTRRGRSGAQDPLSSSAGAMRVAAGR